MDTASKTVAYLLGNIYPKKSHQPPQPPQPQPHPHPQPPQPPQPPKGAPNNFRQARPQPRYIQTTIFPILKGMAQLFLQSDVETFNIKAATLLNPTRIQQEAKKRKYSLFFALCIGVLH